MRDFIDTFPDPRSGEPGLYLKRLDEIIAQELWTIPVDAQHVLQHNPELYHKIVTYPTEVMALFQITFATYYVQRLKSHSDTEFEFQKRKFAEDVQKYNGAHPAA
ncbi:hypothetical protein PAPYR_13507 [Paratrimastix pyriformis]|uniref:MCM N-terminal domain-containing protein n=1 Tax=Paratrimastix pyriformis TaxID=342808 RepID=A0ABQ8U059_9EUKA|nr:hypothetical protein PAPYR_13507 [Paratrimastix pyriformis]